MMRQFLNTSSYTSLNINKINFVRCLFNSSSKFSTNNTNEVYELDVSELESECLIPRSLRLGGMPHQVFIIQPYIKWGPKKIHITTPQLQLEESIALIKTLPGWKVVGEKLISLLTFEKKTFFNKGNLELLTNLIKRQEEITAVFLNVKSLKLRQHLILEEMFKTPVFDRYAIVMNIFKCHAKTKEAKLQVALAEIPYIRTRIKGINEDEFSFTKNVGIGSNLSFSEKRLTMLSDQEQKIRKEISSLSKNRDLLRKKRTDMKFPIVAVVGYTNAGKTSLIKSLTKSDALQPEDKLFATLDVTLHAGLLPNNLKVLYVDTIGFISDVPTQLLEPFVATLEDALVADLIIHVQDISHPDKKSQAENVLNTLSQLNLPSKLAENVITVGNKCDKLKSFKDFDDNITYISCADGIGIEDLKSKIESALFKTTDIVKLKIKVKNGGEEFRWLYKEAAISDITVDEKDAQFVFVTVTISQAKLNKFKHEFIK